MYHEYRMTSNTGQFHVSNISPISLIQVMVAGDLGNLFNTRQHRLVFNKGLVLRYQVGY